MMGNNVLIVDDSPNNLRVLIGMLAEHGYTVRAAPSGARALAAIQMELPDLILLDVMMPDMDGYEVCRKLKENDQTSHIPVIFVSAMDKVFDKLTAFSVGGVDYITKPFQLEEVMARVRTHIALQKMRQQLQEQNDQLQKQNAELDAFAHTVAHDLINPLSILASYAQVIHEDFDRLSSEDIQKIGSAFYRNTKKSVNIVDSLLLLASVRKGTIETEPLDMTEIIDEVLERLKIMIGEYKGEIKVPDSWPMAVGYAAWVEEVWLNYLSNGLKYGGKPPRLKLGADAQPGGRVRFWVRDEGPGLTDEEQATVFTEFTRLSEIRVQGYGLGLSIVRRIMDKLDGEVGVESKVGEGSLFYFTLKQPGY